MLHFLKEFPIWAVNQIIKSQQKQKKISNIVVNKDSFIFHLDDEIHIATREASGRWMMNYEVFTDDELRDWIYRDNPHITIEESLLSVLYITQTKKMESNERFNDYYVDYYISLFEKTAFQASSNVIHFKQEEKCIANIKNPERCALSKELLVHGMNTVVGEWMLQNPDMMMDDNVSLESLNADINNKTYVESYDYT